MAKPLSAEMVEAMLAAQDIALAPGRAERLAPGVNALTVAEAAQGLRRRELSSQDLLAACRARIERWQPRINAFVSQEQRNTPRDGPLGGIPLAHKDMFYRAGRVSNCG